LSAAGDASAMAALIDVAFSPSTNPKERSKAVQQLRYQIRTTWQATPLPPPGDGLFPLSILVQSKVGMW
jgi:hypothetical protein